jgi:hypothetical protein
VRHNEGTRPIVLIIAAALALAACGGSSKTAGRSSTATATPTTVTSTPGGDYTNYYPPGTHRASRQAVAVITAWSDQLRAGHVRRAARYFSLPVIVENGLPPARLTSLRQVLEFNRSLPCGAHAVKTIAGSRYTVTTFVLTVRPGYKDGCGSTGKLAAIAFTLRDGKISEWRRVLVPPPLGPASNLTRPEPKS